ncbi:MAG: CHAT domain-containing protein [Coleofasciculaceae cyanobacterium]
MSFLKQKRKPNTNTLLVLGNPDTTEPPLQYAQQEAEAIAALYQTTALVGRDATERTVWEQAGGAEIVHLAAHGWYNPKNPLFSNLFLAGNIQAEDTHTDGRLEVREVYELDLKATNLVVLSACQTQLGELSSGDEVVGLSRAFMYAGTPSVLASLWKVDDEATGLLMERFYIHLKAGMGKAEALRQAQIEVRQANSRYRHSYYWAAFILTGDGGH